MYASISPGGERKLPVTGVLGGRRGGRARTTGQEGAAWIAQPSVAFGFFFTTCSYYPLQSFSGV